MNNCQLKHTLPTEDYMSASGRVCVVFFPLRMIAVCIVSCFQVQPGLETFPPRSACVGILLRQPWAHALSFEEATCTASYSEAIKCCGPKIICGVKRARVCVCVSVPSWGCVCARVSRGLS